MKKNITYTLLENKIADTTNKKVAFYYINIYINKDRQQIIINMR
jgi:hypothetical protein